jgi:hypothetical protein
VIIRQYNLQVIAKHKREMVGVFHSLMLRADDEWEPNRPYWIDRTVQGAPMYIDVTDEEYDSVEVGDRFVVTISG